MSASIGRRRIARIIALQALYELDCTNHALEDVLGAHLETLAADGELKPDLRRYLYQLVRGVRRERARLDAVIARLAPEFPLEQMAPIDRNLLRIALYEFGISRTPTKSRHQRGGRFGETVRFREHRALRQRRSGRARRAQG